MSREGAKKCWSPAGTERQRSAPELEHLYRIEKFLESIDDMERLLLLIIRETTAATDAESCSLALYDPRTDELWFHVAMGREG